MKKEDHVILSLSTNQIGVIWVMLNFIKTKERDICEFNLGNGQYVSAKKLLNTAYIKRTDDGMNIASYPEHVFETLVRLIDIYRTRKDQRRSLFNYGKIVPVRYMYHCDSKRITSGLAEGEQAKCERGYMPQEFVDWYLKSENSLYFEV